MIHIEGILLIELLMLFRVIRYLGTCQQLMESKRSLFNFQFSRFYNFLWWIFNTKSLVYFSDGVNIFIRFLFNCVNLLSHFRPPFFLPLVLCSEKYMSIIKSENHLHQYFCILLLLWQYVINFGFCFTADVRNIATSSGLIIASLGKIFKVYLYASRVSSSQYDLSLS